MRYAFDPELQPILEFLPALGIAVANFNPEEK